MVRKVFFVFLLVISLLVLYGCENKFDEKTLGNILSLFGLLVSSISLLVSTYFIVVAVNVYKDFKYFTEMKYKILEDGKRIDSLMCSIQKKHDSSVGLYKTMGEVVNKLIEQTFRIGKNNNLPDSFINYQQSLAKLALFKDLDIKQRGGLLLSLVEFGDADDIQYLDLIINSVEETKEIKDTALSVKNELLKRIMQNGKVM